MEKWGKQVPKSIKNCVWDNKTWISWLFAWQFQIWEHLHNFQSRAHLLFNLKFVSKRLSSFEIKSNSPTSHWIFIPCWPNRLNAVKYPWVSWNGIVGRLTTGNVGERTLTLDLALINQSKLKGLTQLTSGCSPCAWPKGIPSSINQ